MMQPSTIPGKGYGLCRRKHSSPGRHSPLDMDEVRIDKWLWATRMFRTRTLAIQACKAGHVKISQQPVKPSRPLHAGEILTVQKGELTRTVKVAQLLDRRVGANVVAEYLEDLTPPEEYERLQERHSQRAVTFPKGFGRPTKKQRRELDRWLDSSE